MNDAIKELTKDYTTLQLRQLADWAGMESRERDPVRIAERQAAYIAASTSKALQDRKDAENRTLVVKLKAFLKPGMKLKMKGCKDGSGIRQFIEWNKSDSLVCWQIKLQRQRIANGYFRSEERTNQVTTHMPDKVTQIFVDGRPVPIKNFILL